MVMTALTGSLPRTGQKRYKRLLPRPLTERARGDRLAHATTEWVEFFAQSSAVKPVEIHLTGPFTAEALRGKIPDFGSVLLSPVYATHSAAVDVASEDQVIGQWAARREVRLGI